jgi:hypothetical protein
MHEPKEVAWINGPFLPHAAPESQCANSGVALDDITVARLCTNHANSDAGAQMDWLDKKSVAMDRDGILITYGDLDGIPYDSLTKADKSTLRKLDALPQGANPILDARQNGNYRKIARKYLLAQAKQAKQARYISGRSRRATGRRRSNVGD